MSQKLSRRVFTAVKSDVLITSQCRYYKFNEVDISAAKTNVRLTSKNTEESKMFNSIKTLIALVNKYDEFKQIGMVIWLLGYYSFILDKNFCFAISGELNKLDNVNSLLSLSKYILETIDSLADSTFLDSTL